MESPPLVDRPPPRISSIRPANVQQIHAAYNRLTNEGKRFFHPGFLGAEPLSARGIAGRILLRVCARPVGVRFLEALRLPLLIGAIATYDSTICGFAFVLARRGIRRRPGTFGVFVLPDCEGQGVGGRLTEHVLDAARATGLREVELTVQTGNERARRLYERHGFAIVATVPQGDAYAGKTYDYHRMIVRLGQPPEAHGDMTSS